MCGFNKENEKHQLFVERGDEGEGNLVGDILLLLFSLYNAPYIIFLPFLSFSFRFFWGGVRRVLNTTRSVPDK